MNRLSVSVDVGTVTREHFRRASGSFRMAHSSQTLCRGGAKHFYGIGNRSRSRMRSWHLAVRPRNLSVARSRPGKVSKLDPLRGTPSPGKHRWGIETPTTHHPGEDASAQFRFGSVRGPPTVFAMIPNPVSEIPPVTDAGANPKQRGPGLAAI